MYRMGKEFSCAVLKSGVLFREDVGREKPDLRWLSTPPETQELMLSTSTFKGVAIKP